MSQGPFLRAYGETLPSVDPSAFVAATAALIGDVTIGPETSVWYGCVLRGDMHHIRVGARTNIQDGTVVHVAYQRFPTLIGDDVTVGHMALIHAAVLEDESFVGMKACVMDGCVIERGGMLAAGALLTPGKVIRAGELWAGSPAKFWRPVGEEERLLMKYTAEHYKELARAYHGHEKRPIVRPAAI